MSHLPPQGGDTTRAFRDRLPLPPDDAPTVEAPPPPFGRQASPDEPTAVMPGRAPTAAARSGEGGAPAAAPAGGGPLLTGPFPGVLPVPRARDDAAPVTVAEGADVGGYLLGRRLAQRPTGELFLAAHPQHGECVVQVLSPGMASTWAGRGFLLEARARTTLDDARLVRVLGVGDAPRPWVAMERLRGPTLRQALDQEGPLAVPEAVRIARELARGLARAHARRLVHGDLTPRDVRLEGEARAVKLTGFGVPKAIGPMGTRHAYAGGPALGEATYAAPELFVDERPGPASDVWSIGVVLHEMLAGRPPFQGSAREVMEAVLRAQPPPLAAVRPDVPPALAAVVARCLARAPEARYPDAQALAAALHAAAPEAEPGRGGGWRLVVALAVVAALAVAGAVAAALLSR